MDTVSQLRRDEGVRSFPYTDTVGKLTIGVGRNLTDVGLSDSEIDVLLQNDIERATEGLRTSLPWTETMDPVRFAVLVNMAFNLGLGGLLGFHKTLTAMEQGDWETASTAMLNSKWAGEVGARAERLARQLKTGEWT